MSPNTAFPETLRAATLALAACLVLTPIFAVAQDAAKTKPTGFYCNMKGLTSAERAEMPGLLDTLINKSPQVRELPDGYELTFKDPKGLFPVAARWMSLENRCCPFFDLSLSAARNGGPLVVQIRGEDGVKDFIVDDLPRIHKLTAGPKSAN